MNSIGKLQQRNTEQSRSMDEQSHDTDRRKSSFIWNSRHLMQLVALILLASTASTTTLATRIDCDLYIAESTIPNAGLGIYTAVAKSSGDNIGNGDKAIPLVDMLWHAGDYSDDETLVGEVEYVHFFNPTQDYVWHGIGMGMDFESELQDDITTFWPGVDAMINCNLGLLNVIKSTPKYDEAGLHRNLHPGAGGITPYDGVPTKVVRDIPAGGELFKHYGDEWFSGRPHFGNIPLSADYEAILELMTGLHKMIHSLGMPEHISSSMIYDDLVLPIKKIWNSRTLNALFDFDWSDVEAAVEARDFGILLQPNATRSLDWLDEHGKCIDHIVHGPSTIEGAGHGAFAKRDLPKGTIITGTPLIHFPDRSVLGMYEPRTTSTGRMVRDVEKGPYSEQVLVNYCFGHPDTTVLLCPYGAGVNYINANRTQANVKVQWAQDGQTNHKSAWLLKDPQYMEFEYRTMLAIDYVALRDINEGEELFLDYGDAWEQAWVEHVKAWKAVEGREEYISATQFNAKYSDTPVRTLEEQNENPYPKNLAINCHPVLVESVFLDYNHEGNYADPYDFIDKAGWIPEKKGFPCDIVKRDSATETYEVSINYTENDESYVKFHKDVPRKAISFVDHPYTTDMHLPNAFRHPIGIPDEMLPDAWRNKVSQYNHL
ncbi:SET methyltransferase domain containing protein [Nitzschia inconspicua]|uniref:SET methyltransferase domain containing protein n=1 Tax=Nitzschia inconspicua TaxID=303405 RepID=A0A9K3KKM9_9STRA|nr:SET methyltransferase domain containing protein [Nitzschia inconspicua]